jgi:hypothetical protein
VIAVTSTEGCVLGGVPLGLAFVAAAAWRDGLDAALATLACLPRFGRSLTKLENPSVREVRRRGSSNTQRATPRRWRICSVGAGAVRQFTITTGHVGSRRRRCPNSEALLASPGVRAMRVLATRATDGEELARVAGGRGPRGASRAADSEEIPAFPGAARCGAVARAGKLCNQPLKPPRRCSPGAFLTVRWLPAPLA